MLKVGDEAPNFDLEAVTGGRAHRVRLSDYRGRNVVIAFHPLDWTPTWAMQLPALNSDLETFAGLNAQVLDISVDSISSHLAWQKQEIGTIDFPMCSDFYPHAAVTLAYGILRDAPPVPGISERAAFIVDKNGRIAYAKLYPLDHTPDQSDLLEALKKLEGRA